MTTTQNPSTRRRARMISIGVLVTAVLVSCAVSAVHHLRDSDLDRHYLRTDGWPAQGEAAYRAGSATHLSPEQRVVPIASVAKVMTAYLVLRAHPLADDAAGPDLTVTRADVTDYARRRSSGQSVVEVAAGERLTERQALLALLLPSANNVAVLLARYVAGSVPAFVRQMNSAARALGMVHTRYTDPSGYLATTVSTAADQLRLASRLAGDDATSSAFGDLVVQDTAVLPVAGQVHTTNVLLGKDGFVGTKTGSDDAAGGCFMFRSWRLIHGEVTDVVGVVLGQHGRHDITAGLYAAKALVDRLGPPGSA